VDKSFKAAEETVTRMQGTVVDFGQIAVDVEKQARQQALGRLDRLLKTRNSLPFRLDDLFRQTGD